jgi:hypothetical protein
MIESQERNELVDNTIHNIRQLMEKWNNRFTQNDPRLIEHYLKGELDIHIQIRNRVAEHGQTWCAVFNAIDFPTSGIGGMEIPLAPSNRL